ncbi:MULTISPECIES: NB-ARC domain-containing protein [unclassified Microcoleus]|uniref:NB-ARC domain-containing protein n=1 Tax=unclassified Microcoleus TaxID=2642155 RepID=UPI002FCFEE63
MKLPEDFLITLATKVGISENEFEVLSRAIKGESMSDISDQLRVRKDALQKRLGEVYKKFEVQGAGPGKLAKLQQILVTEYQKQVANNRHDATTDREVYPTVENTRFQDTTIPQFSPRIDWGKVPAKEPFYGRNSEIDTLKKWIVTNRCRVVTICGMGGIGKTALATQTLQQIQGEFQTIIWRNIATSGPLEKLLPDLLQFLSHHSEIDLPKLSNSLIAQLIEYLRLTRCLLVFDEVETILQSGQLPRHYRPGYESYRELFQQIAQTPHQSCLLLISWTHPIELDILAEETLLCRALELSELPEKDAKQIILSAPKVSTSESNLLSELIYLYGGNPLLLKIAVTHAQDMLAGNLAQLVKKTPSVIEGIVRDYFQEQFQDFHELEVKVLSCLASNKPATLSELQSSLLFAEDLSELKLAVEILIERSLLQTLTDSDEERLTVSPQARLFVTHQLIAKYLNQIGYKKYLESELQTAKCYLTQTLRYNPELPAANYNLGSTYEKLEDLPNARQHYKKAAEYKNSRAAGAAVNNLARLEILSENFDVAVELILSILPQVNDKIVQVTLHKNLGWAYLGLQLYSEAETHLEKAIELDNSYAVAHCLLAQVLEAKGETTAALSCWQKCLNCSTQGQQQEGVAWKLPELSIWKSFARERLSASGREPN